MITLGNTLGIITKWLKQTTQKGLMLTGLYKINIEYLDEHY